MKEVRCNSCNNLLFKTKGEDYEIETVCDRCGHKDVYSGKPLHQRMVTGEYIKLKEK